MAYRGEQLHMWTDRTKKAIEEAHKCPKMARNDPNRGSKNLNKLIMIVKMVMIFVVVVVFTVAVVVVVAVFTVVVDVVVVVVEDDHDDDDDDDGNYDKKKSSPSLLSLSLCSDFEILY